MFKKNKKIILSIAVTLIILIAYGSFLKFRLVGDAYRIINSSDEFIINLKCNEGRILQVIYFFIIKIIGFSINSISSYIFLYRINSIIAIMFLIAAVLLTFKLLSSNIENISKQQKIVVLICSLLIFINVSVSEYMLYLENLVMTFGLLIGVIAVYIYTKDIKFKELMAVGLVLVSSFCYQGVAQIFVILSALVLFLRYPEHEQKFYLKQLAKIFILYLVALIINYLTCWVLNSILPNIDPRVFTGALQSLVQLVSSNNIYVVAINILLIGVLIILNSQVFIGNDSIKGLMKILYLAIICIASYEVFLFNNSVGLLIRTILNLIIIYPVIKIYIISLKKNNKNLIVDVCTTAVVLIIDILLIVNVQTAGARATIKNIDIVKSIVEKIEEYELENNIKVDRIAFYYDKNLNYDYWNAKNILYRPYTVPIYYGYWCDIYSINVIGDKNYIKVHDSQLDKEIEEYYFSKDWKELNLEEQIIFKDNVAHICRF